LATCFGSGETSSGQFLVYRQSAFSECANCGIPYCLQTIFILKFKLELYWPTYLLNMCKNSYQYTGKSILKFMLTYIYYELN